MTTTAIGHKYVTLSHGRTRYLEAGTGHPLILLHGSSIEQGADDWLPCLDVLADGFRVLAPDFLGWPPSDTLQGIDAFPYLTDFVREFQDALGISSSYVVGASMGAWIAGLLAYESPNRVDKAVITGNPGFLGSPNAGISNWKPTPDEEVRRWVLNVTRNADLDREALVAEKLRGANDPVVLEAFGQIMRTMGDPAQRRRYALMRRLPYIKVPVLYLFGKGDPAMAVLEQARKATPNAQALALEAGHRLHIEIPEEFSRAVAAFLRE